MDGKDVKCPSWLVNRLNKDSGVISFYEFMDMALNDPIHGAYAAGNLEIGIRGDFCTSPSLGSDFAEILAIQLVDWFQQLESKFDAVSTFSLVEIGPGEGTLAKDLINAFVDIAPDLISKLEIILVEPSQAMSDRQKKTISQEFVNVSWKTIEELSKEPVVGIILAHEVLDVLPVERFVFKNQTFFRQGVELIKTNNEFQLEYKDLPLTKEISNFILNSQEIIGIDINSLPIKDNWCSEWHSNLPNWLEQVSRIIKHGPLLIIDYALEAKRYYNSQRNSGTLISYSAQKASSELLKDPGNCDLTSHICIESLLYYAQKTKWKFIGETRQGQALLALGLAKRLHSLKDIPNNQLAIALSRRESLLRLVDPIGLGEFRWLAFQKEDYLNNKDNLINLENLFLKEPIIS